MSVPSHSVTVARHVASIPTAYNRGMQLALHSEKASSYLGTIRFCGAL